MLWWLLIRVVALGFSAGRRSCAGWHDAKNGECSRAGAVEQMWSRSHSSSGRRATLGLGGRCRAGVAAEAAAQASLWKAGVLPRLWVGAAERTQLCRRCRAGAVAQALLRTVGALP